ncbi:hypothetical protein ACFO0N_16445 [Halobium salinum]|uniref:Uncharacterized protein n=1 Tax=Halobium salinum TaxID=1364940 RepID=A0ABD5PFJ6_9EURY|nr:hypothetical protein [Halobium salinum]
MWDRPSPRIEKTLHTGFMTGTPDWLRGYGGVTLDENLRKAQLEIQAPNTAGGVEFATEDGASPRWLYTSYFAELRLGCTFSHDLTGRNKFNLTFSDAVGPTVSDDWVVAGEDARSVGNHLMFGRNGSQTDRRIEYGWVTADGRVRCELRIRPGDGEATFLLGDADQPVLHVADADFGTSDFVPKLQVETDNEGTTQSVWLDEVWLTAVPL